MAEHVWSVLCHRAYIDRESNLVTLVEVTERIIVRAHGKDIEKQVSAGASVLQTQLELLSWWVRTDYDTPEEVQIRILIDGLHGKTVASVDGRVNLADSTSMRLRVSFPGFPFLGYGRYWLNVQRLVPVSSGAEEGWETVARLPVELVLHDPGSEVQVPQLSSKRRNAPRRTQRR